MSETYENWLSLGNNFIYCDRQTQEIYQVLPYSVDFKAPGALSYGMFDEHFGEPCQTDMYCSEVHSKFSQVAWYCKS